jgi:hypothetical protein
VHKIILCLAILSAPIFAQAQHAKTSAPNDPSSSPLIVAKGKLVNQTAPIPITTIFTPSQTGLYRLSLYMTTTKRAPLQAWNFNLFWTDDAGAETDYVLIAQGGSPPYAYGTNPYYGTWPGQVITFEAVAGTPVNYSVIQTGPGDSAYSEYYVVEQLE